MYVLQISPWTLFYGVQTSSPHQSQHSQHMIVPQTQSKLVFNNDFAAQVASRIMSYYKAEIQTMVRNAVLESQAISPTEHHGSDPLVEQKKKKRNIYKECE
jgi:hypothetical protein